MIKPPKSFNSKAFLLFYLSVVAFIFVIWASKFSFMPTDKREIPATLSSYLQSPAIPIPQILLYDVMRQSVFTNASFSDRWSFVYFTHGFCGDDCQSSFTVMESLRNHFANTSNQFVFINYDLHPQSVNAFENMAESEKLSDLRFLSSKVESQLEPLMNTFHFLFLKTQTSEGYYLEQEHKIFLVDPKGRFYAVFSGHNASDITRTFVKIREFYARTE